MQNISLSRQIGSVFIVIGTQVGAGILALPLLIAHFGFLSGAVLLFLVWGLLSYTTLMVCELSLAMPDGTSFSTMAKTLLGSGGCTIVWISLLFLLYTISIAYISAAGSSFHAIFHINVFSASLLFVIILGVFVLGGTGSVDWLNRLLLCSKLTILLYVGLILLPQIKTNNLFVVHSDINVMLISVSVLVTAFVAHIIIPTLRTYLHSNGRVLKRVFLTGSSITLLLYILWLLVILGNIPYSGVNSFTQQLFPLGSKANVGDMLMLIQHNLRQNKFVAPVSIFTTISVSTSFLSVSLALKGFVTDGFKLKSLKMMYQIISVAIIVFVIPLLLVYLSPNIFIKALSLVGMACTILFVIMPVLMINKLKQHQRQFSAGIFNNTLINTAILLIGVLLMAIEIYVSLW